MANSLFDKGREGFLSGSILGLGGSIVPYFIGSFNTGLVATGALLSDIPAAVYRARGTYLVNRTASAGVFDADDTVVNCPSSAATVVGLIHVLEAGNPVSSANSLLIHNVDTASVLPFTPNGGDVQIIYDQGANRIFKL